MRIAIRADASLEIGSGHIFRCLTLAQACKRRGTDVVFICLEMNGNLCDYIESLGFQVYRLTYGTVFVEDIDISYTLQTLKQFGVSVDWLVVDHYLISVKWEAHFRSLEINLLVIDDIARSHDCNVLLDQNFFTYPSNRYEEKVPKDCVLLLGPTYSLIREEFVKMGRARLHRPFKIDRIFVFFGGSDLSDQTSKTLEALSHPSFEHLHVDVVVGSANQNQDRIKRICHSRPQTRYFCQIDYMHDLMGMADIAIGAGGTTTWERLATGLPAIVISIADNQIQGAVALTKIGVIEHLGWHDQVSITNIQDKLILWMSSPLMLEEMCFRGWELMGLDQAGLSPTNKVVDCLWGYGDES